MHVWCLVGILKHTSASSVTAYSGCQCDAHLEHLHGAQSGEPPQLIGIHLNCGLQNVILLTCKLDHVATSILSLVFDLSALGQKDGDPGRQTVYCSFLLECLKGFLVT